MHGVPNHCPICGGEITVTRFQCQECDTTFEGRFISRPFGELTEDQLDFVKMFIRCEGKFKRMEDELNLSYPTLRNRLYEVIRALGYEPGASEEPTGLSDQDRQRILENVDKGVMSAQEAIKLLQES